MIRVHHLDGSKVNPQQQLDLMLARDTVKFNALVRELWETGCYVCVAHVQGENMNTAFRATNSVDSAWWVDPQYVPHVVQPKFTAPGGCRSTSVGDVMTVDSEPCCRVHGVAAMGFNVIAVGPPRQAAKEVA